MYLKRLTIVILLIAFVLTASAGCSKFATKGRMMDRVEKRAPVGMSEEDFKKTLPNAELVKEEGTQRVYAVAAGEPCFICGSARAFADSYEIYATLFTFEDGKLVSKERIVSGNRITQP